MSDQVREHSVGIAERALSVSSADATIVRSTSRSSARLQVSDEVCCCSRMTFFWFWLLHGPFSPLSASDACVSLAAARLRAPLAVRTITVAALMTTLCATFMLAPAQR